MKLESKYKMPDNTSTSDGPLHYALTITGDGTLDEINHVSKILSGEIGSKSQQSKITELEAELAERKKECDLAIEAMFNQDVKLEGLKKQLANSVPFGVVQSICHRHWNHVKNGVKYCGSFEVKCTAKNCPLIPKPEQEEVTE